MAVKGVGMIAAGGKGGPTSFPTFIGGRSPQSCTVTDFEMETSNCSSQPSMVHWLSSSIFPFLFVRPSRHGDISPNLTSTCPTPPNPYIF